MNAADVRDEWMDHVAESYHGDHWLLIRPIASENSR